MTTSTEYTSDTNDGGSSSRRDSILPATSGDRPAGEDDLGFGPYVDAVAEFLSSASTNPPLTLSVEGEWGSGKSTFLHLLKGKLNSMNVRTVEFNAWRHDQDEALWASFATTFLDKYTRQLSLRSRCIGHIKLLWLRRYWPGGTMAALRTLFTASVYLAAVLAALGASIVWGIKPIYSIISGGTPLAGLSTFAYILAGSGPFAIALILVAMVPKVWSKVGSPLSLDLSTYFRSPDYEARIAFLERFHEDFSKIVAAFPDNGSRIAVLVDDLDRCDAPRAADVLQAIMKLMADSARIVFVIGMDREKVAAAVAVKHASIIPFLSRQPFLDRATDSSEQTGTSTDGLTIENDLDSNTVALAYGYSYLEKFIQLPFRVPKPTADDIGKLLDTLGTPSQQGNSGKYSRNQDSTEEGRMREVRRHIELETSVDSPKVREIALKVAPVLSNNPRRIKQFLNLFRLRAYIAGITGLPKVPTDWQDHYLRLEAIGKIIVIELVWPILIRDIQRDSLLLFALQACALDSVAESEMLASGPMSMRTLSYLDGRRISPETRTRIKYWVMRSDVIEFLRLGVAESGDDPELDDPLGTFRESPYSFGMFDLESILEVTPRVTSFNDRKTVTLTDSATATGSVSIDTRITPGTGELDVRGEAVSMSEAPDAWNAAELDGGGIRDQAPTEEPPEPEGEAEE